MGSGYRNAVINSYPEVVFDAANFVPKSMRKEGGGGGGRREAERRGRGRRRRRAEGGWEERRERRGKVSRDLTFVYRSEVLAQHKKRSRVLRFSSNSQIPY